MNPITIFDYNDVQAVLTPKIAYDTISDSMDWNQEVEAIKQELVALIVAHLKENKIEIKKARQLAGDFLKVLPIRDQQDLLLKLKNLGQEYAEARQLYVQELGKFNEERRHQALSQMHALIQQGNIEEAIAVAKQFHA